MHSISTECNLVHLLRSAGCSGTYFFHMWVLSMLILYVISRYTWRIMHFVLAAARTIGSLGVNFAMNVRGLG